MAGPDRETPPSLNEKLARDPFAFDFFQAVRLLENSRRDLPRTGTAMSPSLESVRFRQNPSLAFSPSTIEEFRQKPDKAFTELFVRFFGVFGPNAPLPPHLTDYARERILHHDDHTFTAFVNIFHHRLTSFFYRAWAESQKSVDLDRPTDASFPIFIGSVFGMGMESLQNHDAVQDPAKLFFAGRLAPATRNVEGLEAILEDYLGTKTEVQTFVGRYIDLPSDSICKLGASPETGRLGLNAIAGSKFFECQLSIRIKLGPMKLADYERLLPGGSAFKRLKYWILNYCGEHFFWDVQLILKADEVPKSQLGKSGRLGWTTWLSTKSATHDAGDLILNPPDN